MASDVLALGLVVVAWSKRAVSIAQDGNNRWLVESDPQFDLPGNTSVINSINRDRRAKGWDERDRVGRERERERIRKKDYG